MTPSSAKTPTELSIYQGAPATKAEIKLEVTRLASLFPNNGKDFYITLLDLIARHGFTAQRLHDAVDNAAMTCHYPTLTAAEILGFDRRERLYTRVEVCDKINEGYEWDMFEVVKINDTIRWKLR